MDANNFMKNVSVDTEKRTITIETEYKYSLTIGLDMLPELDCLPNEELKDFYLVGRTCVEWPKHDIMFGLETFLLILFGDKEE